MPITVNRFVDFSKVQQNNRKLLQLKDTEDYREAVVVVGMAHTCYGYNVIGSHNFNRSDCWFDGALKNINNTCKNAVQIAKEAREKCEHDNIDMRYCTPTFTECNGVHTVYNEYWHKCSHS